jgi:hypothetical protein
VRVISKERLSWTACGPKGIGFKKLNATEIKGSLKEKSGFPPVISEPESQPTTPLESRKEAAENAGEFGGAGDVRF